MHAWTYSCLPDLNQTLVQRLSRFPRQPDMLCYGMRSAAALLTRGWLKLYHRLQIVGRENLPQRGPFVIVCNHASHLDALCLLSAMPLSQLHRAFPAAGADYFFATAPRTAACALFVNALPFHRRLDVRKSLALCRRLLTPDENGGDEGGNVLIMFPEGTRSPSGEIGRFKPGVGWIVAGTGVPVVPCHIEGTFEAMPKGARLPRPRKVRLRIGRPRAYPNAERRKAWAVAIANDLREAVAALSDEATEGGASPTRAPRLALSCTPSS